MLGFFPMNEIILFNKNNVVCGLSKLGYGYTHFAKKDFKKGDLVAMGYGKIIGKQSRHNSIQIGFDKHILPTKWTGRYWNNSCSPNCYVRTRDDGFPDLIALKKIKNGDEITYSYFMTEYEWDENIPAATIECLCGAPNCHAKLRSFSMLSEKEKNLYMHHVSKYLYHMLLEKKKYEACPDEVRDNYINTGVALKDEELVMDYDNSGEMVHNQIMQKWETHYMRELSKIAAMNGGHILEVGYGMGISAGFIQKSKNITSHTIIECHPAMVNNIKKKYHNEIAAGRLVLLEGFWEDRVGDIADATFDGVLFDSCPLDKEVEFFHFFPFFPEAYRVLKEGGVFTYFSDEPSHLSSQHIGKLNNAGFTKIDYQCCKVTPPESCLYNKKIGMVK
jgi:guanidinoacetate N-methyltransferase